MLQVIKAIGIEKDGNGKGNAGVEEISLVFANKSPADILLREEIEELAARYPGECEHILDSKDRRGAQICLEVAEPVRAPINPPRLTSAQPS